MSAAAQTFDVLDELEALAAAVDGAERACERLRWERGAFLADSPVPDDLHDAAWDVLFGSPGDGLRPSVDALRAAVLRVRGAQVKADDAE